MDAVWPKGFKRKVIWNASVNGALMYGPRLDVTVGDSKLSWMFWECEK